MLLGLTHNMRERGFTNPHTENGRRLWYASAIGTEPAIADVIIDLVRKSAGEKQASAHSCHAATLPETPSIMGQVLIAGGQLRHIDDRDTSAENLRPIASLAEWRELILRDEQGDFRPLRAAPNLRRGWIVFTRDFAELAPYLDYLYPAALANWELWREYKLPLTPWTETAARQTGRFRIVREIDEAAARELAATICDPGCLKKRLWSPAQQTISSVAGEIPLLCPEACNYYVSKAREKLKGPEAE